MLGILWSWAFSALFSLLNQIFYKERLNGHYGVGVFILSNFLSSFPFLAMMSLSTVTITYYMVKLHPGFLHYIYTYLDLLSSIAVIESCMMVVASLVPNFLMGLITGAGIIVSHLPKWASCWGSSNTTN